MATSRVKAVAKIPPKEVVKNELNFTVLDVTGKAKGKVRLPPELFAAKINKQLLAQAVRVYLANQRQGTASTKNRGEVEGSTRKIYRQKGTGRARHGAIRAPIFVGGGVVFGPKPRDYSLALPQLMRRQALAGALTGKLQSGKVIIVDGLGDLEPKTKLMFEALKAVGAKTPTLLVVADDVAALRRSARNLPQMEILPARDLNAYAVLTTQSLVMQKEALAILTEVFTKKMSRGNSQEVSK